MLMETGCARQRKRRSSLILKGGKTVTVITRACNPFPAKRHYKFTQLIPGVG